MRKTRFTQKWFILRSILERNPDLTPNYRMSALWWILPTASLILSNFCCYALCSFFATTLPTKVWPSLPSISHKINFFLFCCHDITYNIISTEAFWPHNTREGTLRQNQCPKMLRYNERTGLMWGFRNMFQKFKILGQSSNLPEILEFEFYGHLIS